MMIVRKTSDYKEISIEETLQALNTSLGGLAITEVENRIEEFGYNEIKEKKKNPFIDFISRFWGFLPFLLEITMILSFILSRVIEGFVILVLLIVNVLIGFFHSRNSQKALEFLKKKLAVKTLTLRDYRYVIEDARFLVPGDIIKVELGDIIPADAKIIEGTISVDQSALTGESLPLSLGRADVVYSSSTVTSGEARCVVLNTGLKSYFGRTAELVKIAKPKSHQKEIILTITKHMMYLGIVALIIVAVYATTLGLDLLSIITFATIFLLGAVPAALPAVFAVVQSVGAMELAKKSILVTRLDSIDDSASMDVLCLDKTGTITQNNLSVVEIIPFFNYTKEDVLLMAGLCSDTDSKNLIDEVITRYAKTADINLESYKCLFHTPFNPLIKRSEVLLECAQGNFKVIKGAPRIVCSLCQEPQPNIYDNYKQIIKEYSKKGYRTIAIARSECNNFDNLSLIGFILLADPVRSDSKMMVEEARQLGLKLIMLTGDNIDIAKEVARQTSIGDKIIRMNDLLELTETQQADVIENCDGFAEIYPEDKYKIVKLLQSKGHVIGMTGDGINDAPALKQAEMGIAVSESTDIAKASASMVLLEEGINVVIDAIKTSRKIYQRMLTWVINKITKTIQFIGILMVGFFWFQDMVISLLGMVLLVFVNDFISMSLSTDNVKHTTNPNAWNIKNITISSSIIGALLVVQGVLAICIGSFFFQLDFEKITSFILLVVIFSSLFRIFILRERKLFWSSKPGLILITTNTLTILIFIFLGFFGFLIPALEVPQVIFALIYSAIFIFSIDPLKYLIFRQFGL